jgi:hypothetical protein
MKRKALALLLSLLLVLGLAACGAASQTQSSDAVNGAAAPETADYAKDGGSGTAGLAPAAAESTDAETQQPTAADESGVPAADKIIYSAYAEIETRDFEASLAGVNTLIARYGGFLESSSVTGNDYSGNRTARYATFVIRVPAENFEALTGSLTELGNVPYSSTNAQNITAQYNDTQSRLDAYNIEYDRLLAMLEKAETVEDMLAIEDRLSDVRYNIQSLSNTISGWDSLLSYSTVQLSLTEVVEYTADPEQGYWESVREAFTATLRAVGNFFSGLLKAVIAYSPVIVLLAAAGAVVFLVLRRSKKRRAARSLPSDGNSGEKGKED